MDLKDENIANTSLNMLKEAQPVYEKAEMDLLKNALQRTYMERFLFATKLYKIQQTLKKATIMHKP